MGKLKSVFRRILLGDESSEYFWKIRNNALSKNKIKKLISIYTYKKYLNRFNAFIPLSTQIQDMPTFPHGLNGIFISGGAQIGKQCVIFHQVTIGSNTLSDSKGKGAPIIGDNVYIGAGAKIIGGVKIGNHVRIGANCVVTKDVPDNTTVVATPIRYITKDKPMNNKFTIYSKSEGL